MKSNNLIPPEAIENKILLHRKQKVMIDTDLAKLYGVTTKRLNEQVKRNRKRFPDDFIFKLTKREKDEVVANCDHLNRLKFSSTLPYAFTEHGTIMLASVLNSSKAIETSIFVVCAIIRLRQILSTHTELAQKLKELELRINFHDDNIQTIFDALNQLLTPPEPQKKRIGFIIEDQNG
jgi:hypothetical protein